MTGQAWGVVGVVLTLCGTIIVALLNQRSQRESTKVGEAAALVQGQVEFIDRQRQMVLDLEARHDRLQARLDATEAERDQAEASLAASEEHNAALRDDLGVMRALVVTQINQEAGRDDPLPRPGGQ